MKKHNILFIITLLLFSLTCTGQSARNNLLYFTRTWQDSDLMECKTQTLLNIKNDTVLMYSTDFCDASGGNVYFSIGYLTNNVIHAISYTPLFENIENIENGPTSIDTIQIEMELSTDRMKLKTTSINYQGPEINIVEHLKPLNYSFYGGVRNFRESPSIKSQIISKVDVDNAKIDLLELGKFEMIGKKFDMWYKIVVNNKVGWIFGGLQLL